MADDEIHVPLSITKQSCNELNTAYEGRRHLIGNVHIELESTTTCHYQMLPSGETGMSMVCKEGNGEAGSIHLDDSKY